MKQILMTTPTQFQVSYEINPHMTGNPGKTNKVRAMQQWSNLRNVLNEVADVIVFSEPPENCPDAVFTANAGLLYKDVCIVSSFKNPERQVEEPYFKDSFEQVKYSPIQCKSPFEGAGDALFSSDQKHLWLGFGHRTALQVKCELDIIFENEDFIVRPLELVDARFYHLDTCFCPLDTGELLWYPAAFSNHAQMVIRSWYPNAIEVHEEDARRFACNAVSIGTVIVTPLISQGLETLLKARGYTVVQTDMSEYLLSGGACKCLTLEVIA